MTNAITDLPTASEAEIDALYEEYLAEARAFVALIFGPASAA